MADFTALCARACLTALFFVSAMGKFMNVAGVANVLSARGVPFPVVFGYGFAALELAGALMVLIGYRARVGAWLLFLLTLGTIIVVHHFWDMQGAARASNQTHALKNLAIMGGLLMVAIAGPGRFSLGRR
jgi:putative oxidoreductase